MLEISGKHQDWSDEMLLDRFQGSGSMEILGELYGRYMHLVYGVSLKYLGEREQARDAVMQIFERLITVLPGQQVKNFRSWLYVLTKNHCLMEIRSRKITGRRMEGLKTELVFMESGTELHPIDRAEASLEDALRECIEKLRSEQKRCIQLFYYKQRCYQEIAAELKMEEKKVKSHLQNGKRNLKICLESNNVTERKT